MNNENKRIAKNAILLSVRSIFIALVGLYTSRLVLNILGIEDFGIYGVIGSIIGLTTFLNTSMSAATSRFITFELGKRNISKLKLIFSTSIRIHLCLALIVIVIGETVGLWYLNHKMVIPSHQLFSAQVLYQLTVFSVIVSFTQVPYGAVIMAHEKMSIYAYFEIIFVVLKLVIVYLLLITQDYRLILYGVLTLFITVLRSFIYRIYCIKHFPEARAFKEYDKKTAKEMISFSGFDFYGSLCVVARNQGQPLILNYFFGVIANAGASIASTVINTVLSLTMNIQQAFNPQIIKQYAQENFIRMNNLMKRSIQFTLFIFSIIAIPLIITTPQVEEIWLGQIPPYSVSFLRLIIISQIIFIGISVNNVSIQATGNVKFISFINGSFYLLSLIISFILLKIGFSAEYIYVTNILINLFILVSGWIIIHKQIPSIPIFAYTFTTLKSFFTIAIVIILTWYFNKNFLFNLLASNSNKFTSILQIIYNTLISSFILIPLFYFFILNRTERRKITSKLKRKLQFKQTISS